METGKIWEKLEKIEKKCKNYGNASKSVGRAVGSILPFDIGERVPGCDVIDDNDTMCSSVICGRNCAKSFLSCGVPNLQFHSLPVDVNCTDFKVHSNGRDVVARKSVIGEPENWGKI